MQCPSPSISHLENGYSSIYLSPQAGTYADSKMSWPLFDRKRSLQRDPLAVQRWHELIQWYKYMPSFSWKVSIIEFYFQATYPVITWIKVSGQRSGPEQILGDLTQELLRVSFSSVTHNDCIQRFQRKGGKFYCRQLWNKWSIKEDHFLTERREESFQGIETFSPNLLS